MAGMSQPSLSEMSPEDLDSLTEENKTQIGAQILALLMGQSQQRPSSAPQRGQSPQRSMQRPMQRPMPGGNRPPQRPNMPNQQRQKMPASAGRAVRNVLQNRYQSLPNPAMMGQQMMQQPMQQPMQQFQHPQIYQNLGQGPMLAQRPMMAFNPNFMV